MSVSSDSSRSDRLRYLSTWQTGAGIVLLGGLGLLMVQAGLFFPTGKPSRDILWILGITELAFYLWVRVFSQMKFSRQIVTLVLFVSVQACLYGIFRLDGFTGDGRLILAWRWTPTPEQLFDGERSLRRLHSGPNNDAVDLTQTTDWDYPAFRGAHRDGIAATVSFATDWDQTPPKQLWKQAIGRGWSSFAAVGEYCVTQEQRRADEVVVCYEVGTGREVWVHADRARFDEPTGGCGPRATPTIHDGRVYALGATGILNCLSGADGEVVWSVNILDDAGVDNRLFGMAGSPLVVESAVVVSPGGRGSSLAAYDLETGQPAWRGGDAEASYSSPQLARFAIGRRILAFNADGLFVHDSDTGQVTCSYPWVSNPAEKNNVCQPVPLPGTETQPDRIFISSGYDKGSAVFEISSVDGRDSIRKVWGERSLKAKFSSVILHAGYVYGLDGSILTCIDLETGRRQWKAGRYGYGQLIRVGDNLLIQSENGDVALVRASPESHQELVRFPALEGRTWNHPVVAGRHLLVRNDREAACYELPP